MRLSLRMRCMVVLSCLVVPLVIFGTTHLMSQYKQIDQQRQAMRQIEMEQPFVNLIQSLALRKSEILSAQDTGVITQHINKILDAITTRQHHQPMINRHEFPLLHLVEQQTNFAIPLATEAFKHRINTIISNTVALGNMRKDVAIEQHRHHVEAIKQTLAKQSALTAKGIVNDQQRAYYVAITNDIPKLVQDLSNAEEALRTITYDQKLGIIAHEQLATVLLWQHVIEADDYKSLIQHLTTAIKPDNFKTLEARNDRLINDLQHYQQKHQMLMSLFLLLQQQEPSVTDEQVKQAFNSVQYAAIKLRATIEERLLNQLQDTLFIQATHLEENLIIALYGFLVLLMAISSLANVIIKPVLKLQQTMLALQDGHTDIAIPYANAQNELGDMARSIMIFRMHLERFQHASSNLNGNIKQAVDGVNSTIHHLDHASKYFAHTTERQSHQVTKASSEITLLSNLLQQTASAGEALHRWIDKLGILMQSQSTNSAQSIRRAHYLLESSHRVVESIQTLESVTKALAELTDQINLISLNASIDAVQQQPHSNHSMKYVASEMKSIAAKVTKIVDHFNVIIATLNDQSKAVFDGSTLIMKLIQELNQSSTQSFLQLDTERHVAEEITHQVLQASTLANEVKDRVEEIQTNTKLVTREAGKSLEQSTVLSQHNNSLKDSVDQLQHLLAVA